MGHADIQTTMRYLHYVPAHDDAARLTAAFAAEDVPARIARQDVERLDRCLKVGESRVRALEAVARAT